MGTPKKLKKKPPKPRKRLWTEEDDRKLVFGWGVFPVPLLAKKLDRTRIAVFYRAKRLGLGGLLQGHKSVAQVARETGYARSIIGKVADTLGIVFRRIERGERAYKTKKLRAIAVTFDQEERIVQYLKDNRHLIWHFSPGSKHSNGGVWGTGLKPPCCNRCKRTKVPHYAKGLCRVCYTHGRVSGDTWTVQDPPCCNRCSKTTKPHYAKGFCKDCYTTVGRQRRAREVRKSTTAP